MTNIHEDQTRTTPIGMARYAADFMAAALATDEKFRGNSKCEIITSVPTMFLVGQAVELSLKAYLLNQGMSLQELRRNFGHELHKTMRKAKELGLLSIAKLNDDELIALEALDFLYASKQLQYIVSGAKIFPAFSPLRSGALKIIHSVGVSVGSRTSALPAT